MIRDKIDNLTEGRIGSAPNEQKVVDELNKSGKIRYKYKVGPGFDDSADKKESFYSFNGINYDAEYGDYYVWSQILEYVDDNPRCNVVYVSNDAKSDFYYRIEGKIRGPNESLRTEMKNHGAAEFLLQNVDTFLHHANNHLNAKIDEAVIAELTNASTVDFTTLPINYMRSGRPGSEHPVEISHFHFDDMKNIEELYSTYSECLAQFNTYKHQLEEINTAPPEELGSLQGSGLMSRKHHLKFNIAHLKIILKNLSEKILYLQEAEAIQQLRENE